MDIGHILRARSFCQRATVKEKALIISFDIVLSFWLLASLDVQGPVVVALAAQAGLQIKHLTCKKTSASFWVYVV